MRKYLGPIALLASPSAFAAGGFTWLGGLSHALHVPEYLLTLSLVGIGLTVVGLIYRSQIAKVSDVVIPDNKISVRSLVEAYGQFIYDQCKAVIGEKHAPDYFTFIATVFLVILSCNLIGLVPGFLPPTEYLNTTIALGIFSFIYYNVQGCRKQGTVNYFKHFMGPLLPLAILIFPIEIISNMIRPMSLAFRLRFNMMGDHIILTEASNLIPLLLPIVFMILGMLVSFIQAYVFTMLTMVYIQMAVAHDHDHH